jgi:hypothetical protein
MVFSMVSSVREEFRQRNRDRLKQEEEACVDAGRRYTLSIVNDVKTDTCE